MKQEENEGMQSREKEECNEGRTEEMYAENNQYSSSSSRQER